MSFGGHQPPPRIAAIVLAAGLSKRMGTNKLLQELDGVPLVARAVDALLDSKAIARVFVVTGHERENVEAALAARPVRFIFNPSYAEGMSTSLRAGIVGLDGTFDAAVIGLGDMPLLRGEHISKLLAAFDPHGLWTIWVPTFEGQRGHPVVFSARHFPELTGLSGDVGARSILERHSEQVAEVPIDEECVRVDVDTPEALSAVRRRA